MRHYSSPSNHCDLRSVSAPGWNLTHLDAWKVNEGMPIGLMNESFIRSFTGIYCELIDPGDQSSHGRLMAFSTKSQLEEHEVRGGENRVIQRFANDNAAKNPEDSLAEALDLVMNQEPSQRQHRTPIEQSTRAIGSSYYEDLTVNPVTPDLRSVNNTLNKEWQLFQQTLDQEQQKREVIYKKSLRQRFSKKKDRKIGPIWRVDAKAGQPLGIEDIKTSVEDARVYWESKPRLAHGKAQKGFHAFCNTLNAHSNLMKLLPQQNQYLSVFCGVTTTLIKASVNHRKIAEVLGESLSEISGPVKDCEAVVILTNTNDMHEAISSLYSHVFHFLYSTMKWYQASTSKRILDSVTENSAESFKDQVAKIQKICILIHQKGSIKSQAEIRHMRLRMEEEASKAAVAREEASEQSRKCGESLARLEALGQQLASILRENTNAWVHKDEGELSKHHDPGLLTRRLTEQGEALCTKRSVPERKAMFVPISRSELQHWSANLEDFTTNIPELLSIIDFSTAFAGLEIIEAIRDWSQSSNSQALWVRGQFQEAYPSGTSAIAAKVISTARAMAIPFLCFFFCIDNVDDEVSQRTIASPCESQEEAVVVDFVYTLIRQLIDQLPSKVKVAGKKFKTRIEKLDGSLHTIGIALRILEELLDHAPATLLVIVDGLEQVEGSDADLIVPKVLLLLHNLAMETRGSKITKILYTTAGTSNALEALDTDFLHYVEAVEGRRKHVKGRLRSLEDVGFDSDAITASSSDASTHDEDSD